MSVEHIDFIVEEPSMEIFLRGLLPRLLGDISFAVYPFQSKQELLTQLPVRLHGYAAWLPERHYIIVIVDRDEDDCVALKQQLEACAEKAGLFTRSRRRGEHFTVINRIAVEELEAWYFGDWQAVCAAYPRVKATVPKQKGFRDPDAVVGGTWEAFTRILQRAGYFKGGLRKVESARQIVAHFEPERNTSRSFQIFRQAIVELVDR